MRTPNLDRLAAGGVRFENAWVQNPVCTPSRMSYLSGQYASAHGFYGLYGREPEQRLTSMFSHFRSQGYRCGALGKLHTPRYWIERDCQFVYDEFIEFPKYLDGAGWFDKNDNRAFLGDRDGETSLLPYEHSCEAVLAGQFGRFLRQEMEPQDRRSNHSDDGDEPWFAWVSFARPHQPYTPSEPFASMVPPGSITLPPTGEDESAALRAIRTGGAGRHGEASLRKKVAAYLGLVAQVDDAIGNILADLEKSGQAGRTIIVYASDHGDYAGEHGMIEKKGGIRARSICRVPLIVNAPSAVARGRVTHEIVESIDLFPTLCELAGLEIPDTVQGRSLCPLLGGNEPQPVRSSALTENRLRKALVSGPWRLVANLPDEQDELYHIDEDPWELHNRIEDPSCREILSQLRRQLIHRLAEAARPVTAFRGGWHQHQYDADGRLLSESARNFIPYD